MPRDFDLKSSFAAKTSQGSSCEIRKKKRHGEKWRNSVLSGRKIEFLEVDRGYFTTAISGCFQEYKGTPKWMVKIMENPIFLMDDLRVIPIFRKHPSRKKTKPARSSNNASIWIQGLPRKKPWKLTAGTCPHGGLVPIMFLSKWVICRFHVNLPGCILKIYLY